MIFMLALQQSPYTRNGLYLVVVIAIALFSVKRLLQTYMSSLNLRISIVNQMCDSLLNMVSHAEFHSGECAVSKQFEHHSGTNCAHC